MLCFGLTLTIWALILSGKASVEYWGPLCIFLVIGLFQTFFPTFDRYALTEERVIIKRNPWFKDSIQIKFSEIKGLSQNGKNIIISDSEFDLVFDRDQKSNANFRIGFWQSNKNVLYNLEQVDWVMNYINGKRS